MSFDFDAAVSAPFRMQPGLRRMADAATHLTPLAAGSRHQREKLAVLSAAPALALQVVRSFDPGPVLHALAAHAAAEQPATFQWDGERACAPSLGVAVHGDSVDDLASGSFGLGDEIGRCLRGLPGEWRLAGLLCLSFVEDFALVDGASGTLPWLAVTLPSHWAPQDKIGRHFREVHAPVADNALLLRAGDHLMRMVCGPERWERFVWNVTRHPRLNAHPATVDHSPWQDDTFADPRAPRAWWRTERQTFIALPDQSQAVFTIHVQIETLAAAIDSADKAARLHEAIATMSEAVLAYRSLSAVREALLAWLAVRAA
ncbi:MAG: heme-dependent oxidative N-demethylase subunit alpha family protein [Pseudomonadota bacterium]